MTAVHRCWDHRCWDHRFWVHASWVHASGRECWGQPILSTTIAFTELGCGSVPTK